MYSSECRKEMLKRRFGCIDLGKWKEEGRGGGGERRKRRKMEGRMLVCTPVRISFTHGIQKKMVEFTHTNTHTMDRAMQKRKREEAEKGRDEEKRKRLAAAKEAAEARRKEEEARTEAEFTRQAERNARQDAEKAQEASEAAKRAEEAARAAETAAQAESAKIKEAIKEKDGIIEEKEKTITAHLQTIASLEQHLSHEKASDVYILPSF